MPLRTGESAGTMRRTGADTPGLQPDGDELPPAGEAVRPRWSWRWLVGFLALVIVLHEMHELAHTWLGRLLCGSWGIRDFNTWSLASGCETWLPTAAGPLFTYAVLWLGAGLLLTAGRRTRSAGLALVFGANPLARLLTAALGGGDELTVALALSGGSGATLALWGWTVALVVLVCAPPLAIAWRALRTTSRPRLWFAGLFLGPTVAVVLILLIALNGLLGAGLLATPVILGEPALVLLTTVAAALVLAATGRQLVRA